MTEVHEKIRFTTEELPVHQDLRKDTPTDAKVASLKETFAKIDGKLHALNESSDQQLEQLSLSEHEVKRINTRINGFKRAGGFFKYVAAPIISIARPYFQLKAAFRKWQTEKEIDAYNKLINEEKSLIKSVQYFREAGEFFGELKKDSSNFDQKIEDFVGKGGDARDRFVGFVEQVLISRPEREEETNASIAWTADFYLEQVEKGRSDESLLGLKELLINSLRAELQPPVKPQAEASNFLSDLKKDPANFDSKLSAFVGEGPRSNDRFIGFVKEVLDSRPKAEEDEPATIGWYASLYLEGVGQGKSQEELLGVIKALTIALKDELNPSWRKEKPAALADAAPTVEAPERFESVESKTTPTAEEVAKVRKIIRERVVDHEPISEFVQLFGSGHSRQLTIIKQVVEELKRDVLQKLEQLKQLPDSSGKSETTASNEKHLADFEETLKLIKKLETETSDGST